ncbi:MAG: hydantoinase/oxoprolinase family protein [Xanthobacteraceae bacterium]|nr:MAG: hydantoinase/oxoprolinase family protein [Xanthobacteraceae bacterium]
MTKAKWVVGTDIGGTFTDIIGVNMETGEQKIGKVPSTPPTYFDGVINGLIRAGIKGEEVLSFRHGATVSTNAILERKGVKTALITTEGFRDVLGGGRAERISAFELDWDPPDIIIPRRNVLGIRERVSPYGEILVPLNEDDIKAATRKIKKRGIESVAIVFIDSFMNPIHEIQTREMLRRELPDIDITVSHEVLPQMLEFERTCTTVLNAYISPILKNYLGGLSRRLKTDWNYSGPILVTTSGGGVIGMDEAVKFPARTFHSSPVSGAVGMAGYIGGLAGFDNVIAFETGGTTNNVSMIYKGTPAITHEWKILWNVPCCLPSVDTVYIGAGGGSIGSVDKGKILNVGPQSMGAVPGPACYGMGGDQPTNTDCQIVLGRIDPDYYLGGELKVDGNLSEKALAEKVGVHYGWDAEISAANMYMVALTNLMMAMRIQTVSRGWDPRDFAIVPYGGGGAMYACDLAREIGSSTVVIPPLPGYASAFGAIRVDVKHEFTKAIHKTEEELNFSELNKEFSGLQLKAESVLKSEGMKAEEIRIQRFVDIKYFSQSRFFTVTAPEGDLKDLSIVTKNFLSAMQIAYGYTLPPGYAPVELVNLRVVATGQIPKPSLPTKPAGGTVEKALKGHRRVWYKDGGFVEAAIYERDRLPVGGTFDGPAIVEQPDTTSVLPPGTHCRVDEYGNLIIKVDR